MNPDTAKSADWITPLILFIPVTSIAAIHGSQAEALRLPTAWFAQSSHLGMFVLIILSFFIPKRQVARVVYYLGFGCAAYAPILLSLGSIFVPLSRPLSCEEGIAFRLRFAVPMIAYLASGEDGGIRVRRQDFTDSMESYLRSIKALRRQSETSPGQEKNKTDQES